MSCGHGEKRTLGGLRFSLKDTFSTYNVVWHNALHQLEVTAPRAEERTVLYVEAAHTDIVRTTGLTTHLVTVLRPIDLPNPRQESPLVAVTHVGLLHLRP